MNITREELFNYLFNCELIDYGCYGIVNKIDDDNCVKLYYKDIFDGFSRKDMDLIDEEIDTRVEIEKYLDENDSELSYLENRKLELLIEKGFIKEVLMYRNYKIGIIMKYYKGYDTLGFVAKLLDKKEKIIVLKKVRKILDDLLKANIFPQDLSIANILVNIKTLDVVFIDLDDSLTRYDTDLYFKEKPKIKTRLLRDCNDKFKSIENYCCNL